MTSDTVAGERPRCSAKNFKLTDCAEWPPRGRDDAPVLGRVMGCSMRVVWHTEDGRASDEVRRQTVRKCTDRPIPRLPSSFPISRGSSFTPQLCS